MINEALLSKFISKVQLKIVNSNLKGEEAEFFVKKMAEIATIIQCMPKTYETDGQGKKAIAYLHYFKNGCDWFITERDCMMEEPQYQAFGFANLGHGGELGYISIEELIQSNAELDFYWTPVSIEDIEKKV